MLSPVSDGAGALARRVIDQAQALYGAIFDPWYDAGVSAHNAAGVQMLASSIAMRWLTLKVTNEALQATPAEPSNADLMKQAATEVNNARLMIGQMGLLEYRHQPVLGRYPHVDPGADPVPFLMHWASRAAAAIGTANQVLAECNSAKDGQLDGDQALRISGLMADHQEPLEVVWLHNVIIANGKLEEIDSAALPPPKQAPGPFNIPGAEPKPENLGHALVAEKAKANDHLSLTRDGGDPIDPQKQEEMLKDADAINDEVNALIDVDSQKIHDILAKYSPKERAQFFRVLERRNLLGNIVHRYSSLLGAQPILNLIHATPGYESWKYDPNMATARGLGEQALYIADEMVRELPGALCQFAAGFFKGLASLPIVGGLFDRAADGMKDLAKSADKLTGAWDDPEAKKWRDGVAQVTGFAVEKIGEVAVGGKLGGAAEMKNVAEFVKVGTGVVKTAELVKELKEVVEEAEHFVPKTMKLVENGINLFSDVVAATGNDKKATRKALEDFSKAIDDLMGKGGEEVEQHVTVEGKKEKKEADEKFSPEGKKEAEERHTQAVLDGLPPEVRENLKVINEANVRMLSAKNGKEQEAAKAEMVAAGESIRKHYTTVGLEVQNADKEKEEKLKAEKERDAKADADKQAAAQGQPAAPEKNEALEHAKELAKDTLWSTLIELGKGILKKEKDVAVDAVKELIGDEADKPEADDEEVEMDNKRLSIGGKLWNAFKAGVAEGAAEEANEIIHKQLNERLATLLAKELGKAMHVDLDAVIQPAIKEILGFVETKLQIKKRIEEALDHAMGVKVEGPEKVEPARS
jgi:hypothetical protein